MIERILLYLAMFVSAGSVGAQIVFALYAPRPYTGLGVGVIGMTLVFIVGAICAEHG